MQKIVQNTKKVFFLLLFFREEKRNEEGREGKFLEKKKNFLAGTIRTEKEKEKSMVRDGWAVIKGSSRGPRGPEKDKLELISKSAIT